MAERVVIGTKTAGDLVSYTLTLAVQNGPIPNVTVVDDLPEDFGTPSNISDGGVYDDLANTITWTLVDVADGTTLTYDVTIGATTAAGAGTRVLQGCYLDHDDLYSRYRVLSRRTTPSTSQGATTT